MTITSLDRVVGTEALRDAQRIFDAAGFVIVPKEPTRKMIDAAGRSEAADVYRAMLKAAPKLV
jgi:hypothetical protein